MTLNQQSEIKNQKCVISLIGAGGKTTLMFRLAAELAASGNKVLTTTTTKIMMPDKSLSPLTLLADSTDALIHKSKTALEKYPHFSAGSGYNTHTGKLEGLEPCIIDELFLTRLFDYIIVEADGAKQKPLKASASHEPVLPESSCIIILLAGLDVIGQPLDDKYVHRSRIIAKNTGLEPGAAIDENAVFSVLKMELKKAASLCNAKEYFVFLNKADTKERLKSAMLIRKMLKTTSLADKIVIAALQNSVAKYI